MRRQSKLVLVFAIATLCLQTIGGFAPNRAVGAAEKPAVEYFALGDSIASGHGLQGAQGNCLQSSHAYPYKVRDILATQYTVKFPASHHLACSGSSSAVMVSQLNA